MEQQELSVTEFERLMTDEACVRHARLVPEYDLERELADLELLIGPARHPASPEGGGRPSELETKRPEPIRLRVGP
jgi:hypothetical protein